MNNLVIYRMDAQTINWCGRLKNQNVKTTTKNQNTNTCRHTPLIQFPLTSCICKPCGVSASSSLNFAVLFQIHLSPNIHTVYHSCFSSSLSFSFHLNRVLLVNQIESFFERKQTISIPVYSIYLEYKWQLKLLQRNHLSLLFHCCVYCICIVRFGASGLTNFSCHII